MTREQAKQFLAEDLGIENPSSAQVTTYLNKMNEENKAYANTRVSEEQEKYKGWVSPDEHKKTQDELSKYKDSTLRAERHAKYRDKNIDKDFFDFVDSKLKETKDFDKDLDQFIKDNPKFLSQSASPSPSSQQQRQGGAFVFSGGQQQQDRHADVLTRFNDNLHGLFSSKN